MTTTFETPPETARLPVSELGSQARTAPSPGRVIATMFAGLFFALGFLLGGAWRGLAFCAVSARYGYWKGLGWTDEKIAAVIAARDAARQPAPPQPAPARA
jgi:hypothetical protein